MVMGMAQSPLVSGTILRARGGRVDHARSLCIARSLRSIGFEEDLDCLATAGTARAGSLDFE
jgi:hypothetical protein